MTTTTERKTCEQLVDQELKDRLEQIRKSAGSELDPDDEDNEDHFEPLSISRFVTYEVDLSCGGPADWFELYWNGEWWRGGRYNYQDRNDGAARKINRREAEEIAVAFGIYPNLED
jgi:hypothetical protein